ncbi:MAG TPA: 16S rRNA (cytidine(1402)-2'-O)-methyltransferase [Balneolales bacterium]|nr:16S rRNA (cytidine(1402)-2'-O)-methyltransferase [Balneolales bacterium]
MATLFIVATPIGNLDDFSNRAIQTLKDVDFIACEDTRTSSVLLHKFQIQKPTFSFHQHNEHAKVKKIIDLLNSGHNVAVISDAGMPGISDPGFLAVRAAHQASHKVTVIPGPSAVITAIIASGLPCDRFVFEGFLPAKKGRKTRIEELSQEERTIVLYESPYRIKKLIDQLIPVFGEDRLAALTRELTKKFEEIIRGSLAEIRDAIATNKNIKGEMTLVIAGKNYSE